MNRTKLLAITTVLIAVMAVIGAASALKGGQKPLKGVYVSGGDKKMYVIDPDTMTVIASKYVGQSSTWPSNQYPGDKYIWLPGGGTQGLTVINSKDLSVACKTGYGSNWVEVTPDNTLAYVTTLGTDTIIKVNGDVSAGCPNTAAPLDKTVYDTTKHDGPCDMTVSPDANWLCIPDIYSGITNGNGMDSITMVNANNLNDNVILYMPRCNDAAPIMSFMTTIDPHGNVPYCFVENFESLVSSKSGSESVIDISDPRNPKEIVRFIQDPVGTNCPNAVLGSDGEYRLPNGAIVRGGYGLIPRSDEFTHGLSGGRLLNFVMLKGTQDVAVIDVKTLKIKHRIALPSGCKTDTGDFSRDRKKFFVNCDKGNKVCRIDVDTESLDGCVDIGTRARGITVK